jgi:hypothetical protein
VGIGSRGDRAWGRGLLLAASLVALLSLSSVARALSAKAPKHFVHEPIVEQAILTPVPVWVETRDDTVKRLVLRYRAFGVKTWTAVDLVRGEDGWSAQIPCRDIGNVVGTLRYFLTSYDATGKTLESQGTDSKPLLVKIRRTIKSPPPHLPGRPPPAHCIDAADCPPDFPGCTRAASGSASADDAACMTDDDCNAGMQCTSSHKCELPTTRQRKNWISVGGIQDFVIFSGADLCSNDVQESTGGECLRESDGVAYHGNPLAEAGASLHYGPTSTRIFLGYDRFLAKYFSIGLRVGYLVRGAAPQLGDKNPLLPLSGEARMAVWLAAETVVRPFIFAAGGYAQYDLKFRQSVDEDPAAMPAQPGNPPNQILEAWARRGPWFVGGGLGMMFATSGATGFILEVKAVRTLPAQATIISPDLSFAVGF